jgi:hypothetical protein
MGSVHGAPRETGSDDLKLALEKEMFEYLREQNLQLKAEDERLKQGRQHGSEHSEHGHGVSSTSWSEVGGDGSSTLNGAGMKGCSTPRKNKLLDGAYRFTPNGTRAPDTSPQWMLVVHMYLQLRLCLRFLLFQRFMKVINAWSSFWMGMRGQRGQIKKGSWVIVSGSQLKPKLIRGISMGPGHMNFHQVKLGKYG